MFLYVTSQLLSLRLSQEGLNVLLFQFYDWADIVCVPPIFILSSTPSTEKLNSCLGIIHVLLIAMADIVTTYHLLMSTCIFWHFSHQRFFFFFFFNEDLESDAYVFDWLIDWLILAVLGLRFCARALSSRGKRGPLFIAMRGPPTAAASLAAEHRLQTRRLSSHQRFYKKLYLKWCLEFW